MRWIREKAKTCASLAQNFSVPKRSAACGQLSSSMEMCGSVAYGGVHARAWLMRLEELTRPG